MDPYEIIRLEGSDLQWLKNALSNSTGLNPVRVLRIYKEGDRLKFKINEHTWTVPMGISEGDYEDMVMNQFEKEKGKNG